MATDWYKEKSSGFKLSFNKIVSLFMNPMKASVNSLKNDIPKKIKDLKDSTLEISASEKTDLLTQVARYQAIYDEIIAQGF